MLSDVDSISLAFDWF